MNGDGIEVLHVMDWLKREKELDQKQSVEAMLGDWVKLINKQSIYATKTINKNFYSVIKIDIKPTGG